MHYKKQLLFALALVLSGNVALASENGPKKFETPVWIKKNKTHLTKGAGFAGGAVVMRALDAYANIEMLKGKSAEAVEKMFEGQASAEFLSTYFNGEVSEAIQKKEAKDITVSDDLKKSIAKAIEINTNEPEGNVIKAIKYGIVLPSLYYDNKSKTNFGILGNIVSGPINNDIAQDVIEKVTNYTNNPVKAIQAGGYISTKVVDQFASNYASADVQQYTDAAARSTRANYVVSRVIGTKHSKLDPKKSIGKEIVTQAVTFGATVLADNANVPGKIHNNRFAKTTRSGFESLLNNTLGKISPDATKESVNQVNGSVEKNFVPFVTVLACDVIRKKLE